MNIHVSQLAVISGGIGFCLAIGFASPATAQLWRFDRVQNNDVPKDLLPKVRRFERTDLFLETPVLRNGRNAVVVPREEAPLVLFKVDLRTAKSREEFIEAAKRFLEREGFTVTRASEKQ